MSVVQLHRHGQPGYFSLAQVPQQPDVSQIAISTGWWELDQIWRLYPGQFNVVTGIAGHGKSTFLLNVLCNLYKKHGTKSFLYVPENEAHVRDKLRTIWGAATGFDEFCESGCFLQSAVPGAYDDKPQTLAWVLDQAVVALEQDAADVVLIDPWNELEHAKPRDLMMTDYIRDCLMYLKQFCRATNATVIMVAHPTKAGTSDGRIPGLADIEGCYSDDTEVLTRRGWLHHSHITLADDVACFDSTNSAVVYAQPSNILRKEFDGEMFRFRGLGYDLLVTPQHRMLIQPEWTEPVGAGGARGRPISYPKGQWSFCRAESLPGSQFVVPLAGEPIGGADPETVVIGEKIYPAEAFWRLVGWFVAEGHCGPTGLTWSQAEGVVADQFTAAFAEAGIPATIGWQQPHGNGKLVTGRWYIGARYCRELVSWFRRHCGEGAKNKRVPVAVFDLSPRLKWAFLSAYLEGDGSVCGDGFTASTVSVGLRDDLQRLAVELGLPTRTSTRPASGNAQQCYVVGFGAEGRRIVSLRTQRNASRQNYSGLVWCLTVPTGAYFVRRNGQVTVCGNSMNWYNKCDNGLIVARDLEKPVARVISAKAREQGSGKRGVCYFHVDPQTGVFTPQQGAVTP